MCSLIRHKTHIYMLACMFVYIVYVYVLVSIIIDPIIGADLGEQQECMPSIIEKPLKLSSVIT